MIKTHVRQPRGGRATDHDDYPAALTAYTTRTQAVLGQDAALGGQPALSLLLGDPDVAEDCWVHGDIC